MRCFRADPRCDKGRTARASAQELHESRAVESAGADWALSLFEALYGFGAKFLDI